MSLQTIWNLRTGWDKNLKGTETFHFGGRRPRNTAWPDLPSFYGLSADGAIDTVQHKIRGGPWLQGLIMCNLSFHLQKKNSSSFKTFMRMKRHRTWLWVRTFYAVRWVCLTTHSGTREFNLKWWNRFTLKVSDSASGRRLPKQTHQNSPNSKNPTWQAQRSHSHSHKGLMTSRRPVAQHIVSRNFQVLRSLVVTRPQYLTGWPISFTLIFEVNSQNLWITTSPQHTQQKQFPLISGLRS